MRRILLALMAACALAAGADLSANLLAAASSGNTGEVKKLLDKGADVEARDKNGRTPLMLAAQHGRADVVRLLLARGARAGERDKVGWTAYGLALFDAAGHGDHEAALKALPAPPKVRLEVASEMNPARLQSSCYLGVKGELQAAVTQLHLNGVLSEELLGFANSSGRDLVEIVRGQSEPADAVLSLTVIPGVACEPSGGDNLTLSIDARLFRASDRQLLFEKSFGGGFKGLRSLTVHNIAQYGPVFLDWIRPQAGPIYWAVVETLSRSNL